MIKLSNTKIRKSVTKSALMASVSLVLTMQAGLNAHAQDNTSNDEVVVTGTYLRQSQSTNASPVATFDRDDFDQINASTIETVIANLTSNTGSQNNVDSTTQLFTTGTSNFNLRGLGVGSTLVLQNSRRQVKSSISTNAGEVIYQYERR